MPIVLASNNEHKLEEISRILGPGLPLVLPVTIGLSLLVEEDGTSFAENASIKARAFAQAAGMPALADDSGLEVEALGGRPGIFSARFGGPGLTDAERVNLLLEELAKVPDGRRGARFISAVALATPDGEVRIFRGSVEGSIADMPRGSGGFGYDPVFLYPPLGKTFGEMTPAEKDAVSHRSAALRGAEGAVRDLV